MDPLQQVILVYDDSCPVCRATQAWVMKRALPGKIRPVPCQSEERSRRCPQIPEADCMRAIHLVLPDGRVLAGDRALPFLFRMLKGWRWVAALLELPLVRLVSPGAYAWFAANRYAIARLAGFRNLPEKGKRETS